MAGAGDPNGGLGKDTECDTRTAWTSGREPVPVSYMDNTRKTFEIIKTAWNS